MRAPVRVCLVHVVQCMRRVAFTLPNLALWGFKAACGGADVVELVVFLACPLGPAPLAARGLAAVLARAGPAGTAVDANPEPDAEPRVCACHVGASLPSWAMGHPSAVSAQVDRSEERRVGKECRP